MKVAFYDELTDVVVYKNITTLPRVGDDIVILGDWREVESVFLRVHGNWKLSADIESDAEVCVWLVRSPLTQNSPCKFKRARRLRRLQERLEQEAAVKEEPTSQPNKTLWSRIVAWIKGCKL